MDLAEQIIWVGFFSNSDQDRLSPIIHDNDAVDEIEIEFRLVSQQNSQLHDAEISGTWHVRNNHKTRLEEVLEGLAVFVADESDAENHVGVSDPNWANPLRKVDFAQELVNQVVPRRRNLADSSNSIVGGNYTLIEENGIFGQTTRDALRGLKDNFNLWNRTCDFANNNCNVRYGDRDDTSKTFRKLMKDYGHRATPTNSEFYLHRIIDKKMLVGDTHRQTDKSINGRLVDWSGQVSEDTGLYELYDNVVMKFTDSMMNLARSYMHNGHPNNINHSWNSRLYHPGGNNAVPQIRTTENLAVSYAYGGRHTILDFVERVSIHGAPSRANIDSNFQNYAGNIGDGTQSNPSTWPGIIGGPGNNHKWPGLIDSERLTYQNRYEPNNWAGIDCMGLVLRAIQYAATPATYAADQMLAINGVPFDNPVEGVSIDASGINANHSQSIHTRDALHNTNVNRFFNPNNDNLVFRFPLGRTINYLHRGDVLVYQGSSGFGHITFFFSNRLDANGWYRIIHASGNNEIIYNPPGLPSVCTFNRKVVINLVGNGLQGGLTTPDGFGRIKLWEE